VARSALDTLGFVESVRGLPEQVGDAHRMMAAVDPARFPRAEGLTNVVVCGMGGSGIVGDVVAAATSHELALPVVVCKQIRLPRFVGPSSLVFAVSYSGATEETLAMAAAALEAGAQVVAVCAGGPLAELVGAAGGLVLPCPEGLMPRAALGALVVPVFVALFRMGLLPGAHAALVGAEAQLGTRRDACAPEVTGDANPARALARRIGRTIPVVYGTGALGAVAAQRWKADVNETAKAPAFWNAFPELDHNEICGWGQHGDVTRQVVTLVELRHDQEHPSLDRRVAVTREIVEETVAGVLEARAEGEGRLAQLLDLMYLGDWVSVYLAADAGVDPGPIDAIARLKAELAGLA
jgi:glucose/mannose-6-phosphate isomerase